jgi:tetratricopeptide (TPR) repeat protein
MLSILVSITLFFSAQAPRTEDNAGLRQAALTEFWMGRYANAEELIRKALALIPPSNNEYEVALNHLALGDILQGERRFLNAEQEYRKAIPLLSDHREWSHDAATVWRHLAAGLAGEARYREALAALKKASALVSNDKVEDPGLNAQILNDFGFIYYKQRTWDKAEKFFLRASAIQFTPSNPLDVDQWQILNNLGNLYQHTRKYAKAEDVYTHALQLAEVRRGPSHPALSVVLGDLGMLYVRIGRYQEAESRLQRSREILEHSRVSYDPIFMMRTLYGLGETYHHENDPSRAEEMLARATEIARKLTLPTEMPEVLEVLNSYAKVLNELSHSAEAERLQAEVQRIRAAMAYTVPLGNANYD